MTKYRVKATNPATGYKLDIHGLAALSVDDAMNKINDIYPGYRIDKIQKEPRIKERCEIVRAMETLARAINDEDVFEAWLIEGVADGDIEPGTTDDELEYYIEDETFADLMDLFLQVMNGARKSGGLYVDGVVSKPAG